MGAMGVADDWRLADGRVKFSIGPAEQTDNCPTRGDTPCAHLRRVEL
jgi:hypothetical protein